MYTLPSDRSTHWLPGVPGGVPQYSNIHSTLTASTGNRYTAIQNALNAAGAVASASNPRVVLLGSGTFDISVPGAVNSQDDIMIPSYVVLRGAGTDSAGNMLTILRYRVAYLNGPIFGSFSATAAGSTNLSTNAVKGAYSVRLTSNANTAGFAAGQQVVVDEITDHDLSEWSPNYTPPGDAVSWYSRTDRTICQTLVIDHIDGVDPNIVWFTTPLHYGFRTAFTAQLTRFSDTPVVRAGIEDLRVFKEYQSDGMYGYDGGNIKFGFARECWAKHIEADGSAGQAVGFRRSFRCELRDSYLHDTQYYHNGGWGYGLDFTHGAANNLAENNIIIRFNKVSNMRASGGGNVVAYNYTDDGAIDYSPDWIETGIQGSHHPCPHHELFEGNYSWNADGDSTTGTAIYITFFRNHLSGIRRHTTRSAAVYGSSPNLIEGGPSRCAAAMWGHRWYSYLGNVLGTSGQTTAANGWAYEQPNSLIFGAKAIWALGWTDNPDQPGNGHTYNDDPRVGATMLRDGNYDYLTNSVRWHGIGGAVGAGTPDTLPNSLYLKSKPEFMGSLRWPWVDPIGATKTTTLPARARYDAGTPNILATGMYPSAMELLSRSVPATSSAGSTEAGDAQDASYASDIFGTSNYADIAPSGGWVAYDLSSVDETKRRYLYVGLYFNGADGALNRNWSAGQDDATPTAYVLEGATSGSGPWTALVTVNEVRSNGRAHLVNFYGYTFLRFRSVSGPGCKLKMHVYDGYEGVTDHWAFYGDSIMMDLFANRYDNGQGDPYSRFSAPINSAYPTFFPHVVGGGIGGSTIPSISDLINTATGEFAVGVTIPYKTAWSDFKYIAICYGANDINQGAGGLAGYLSGYLAATDAYVAQGSTVVIQTMSPGTGTIGGLPFNSMAKRYIGTIGLHAPNWSNGTTYAAYDHVWSNGRVYMCTTGGVSTIAPSGTGTGINGGGGSLWDYVQSLRELRLSAVTSGNIIAGPDVFTAFQGHPEYLRDGLHYTGPGMLAWWSAWSSWAQTALYGPAYVAPAAGTQVSTSATGAVRATLSAFSSLTGSVALKLLVTSTASGSVGNSAGLFVVNPTDQLTTAFPISANGTSVPGAQVRVYNNDTGELIGSVNADGLGNWSLSITHG